MSELTYFCSVNLRESAKSLAIAEGVMITANAVPGYFRDQAGLPYDDFQISVARQLIQADHRKLLMEAIRNRRVIVYKPANGIAVEDDFDRYDSSVVDEWRLPIDQFKLFCSELRIKVLLTPEIRIPLQPREIPAELKAMPDDTRVLCIDPPICGRSSEFTAAASEVVRRIQELISRHSSGWLTLEEAAQILENSGRGIAKTWRKKFAAAALDGGLVMHEPDSIERKDYDEGKASLQRVRSYHDWAHVEDLDEWLSKYEPRLPFRFVQSVSKVQQDMPTVQCSENKEARQNRRLKRLRELGGDRKSSTGNSWKATGKRGALAALAKEETLANRPYRDVRDVSKDCDAAAARERFERAIAEI